MKYTDLVKPAVLTQPVYEPGKPIEYVARDYGLDPAEILKLASNENPLGLSPRAREAAVRALDHAHLYPDGAATRLRERIAGLRGVDASQLILGNGSNEIFELMGHAFIGPGDEVVYGAQAFIVYKLVTLLFGGTPVEVPMPAYTHDLDAMRQAVTARTRLVFLASPNNPTGTANPAADIVAFARSLPQHVIFCLDEAYAEYLDEPADLRPLIDEGRKVVCTRTFSKIYGMGGFRLGYAYAAPALIALLHQVRQPFNTSVLAQAAGLAALDDVAFVHESIEVTRAGRHQLTAGLRALGLEVEPGSANFVMVRVPRALEVFQALQERGIIVRPLGGYGLPQHLRITIGREADNARLLATLEPLLAAATEARGGAHR